MQLTSEQFLLFQHAGYLLLDEVLEAPLREEVGKVIERLVQERTAPLVFEDPERPGYGVMEDVGTRVLRLSKVIGRHEIFLRVASARPLLDVLVQLLGPNVELALNRHNHVTLRPPGIAFLEWHRDCVNWSRPLLSAIFYFEDSTVEKGCTWVVPGSQHLLEWHARHRQHARMDSLGPLTKQAVPITAKAGDVLLLNGYVMHGASPNVSQSSRLSMTLGYHSADELSSGDEPLKYLVCGQRELLHN